MSKEVYESYKQSGEFISWSDEKIKRQARQGVRWTPFQAICYLSYYDPDDDKIKPGSGHMYSPRFLELIELFQRLVAMKEIVLEESYDAMTDNKIMVAENIMFIRKALENGFNDVPEVFKVFEEGYVESHVAQVGSNDQTPNSAITQINTTYIDTANYIATASFSQAPKIELNDQSIKTHEIGKKAKDAQTKASKAGVMAKKDIAEKRWSNLLNEAAVIANDKPGVYTATDLARIVIKKLKSAEKVATFQKKISKYKEIIQNLKIHIKKHKRKTQNTNVTA